MAFTRFSGSADVISQLSDQPNDNEGLSAAQLKACFDAFGAAFKEYFNNTFIPEAETAINAAATGVGTSGFSGAIITDGTITNEKLSSTTGFEAVSTLTLRDHCVTLAKLSSELQTIINSVANKGEWAQHQITLESGQASWTKTIAGIKTTSAVIVTPGTDDTSRNAWVNYQIHATGQTLNQLTFAASGNLPSAVNVNVLVLN